MNPVTADQIKSVDGSGNVSIMTTIPLSQLESAVTSAQGKVALIQKELAAAQRAVTLAEAVLAAAQGMQAS